MLHKESEKRRYSNVSRFFVRVQTFVWERYFVCLCIAYKLTLGKTFTDTFSQRKIQ